MCLTLDMDGLTREDYIADFAVDSKGDELFILTSNCEYLANRVASEDSTMLATPVRLTKSSNCQ